MNHGGMSGMSTTMGNMDMANDTSCGMMSSYFTTKLEVFMLFRQLCVTSDGEMAGACIVTVLLTVLYEGLKTLRAYLDVRQRRNTASISPTKAAFSEIGRNTVHSGKKDSYETMDTSESKGGSYNSTEKLVADRSRSQFNCYHVIQTILHTVQTFWSLIIMLIFMTFNAWLCTSVALGAGLGYFVFGWMRLTTLDRGGDHCN